MKILSYRHQTREARKTQSKDGGEKIRLWKMDSLEMIDSCCNNEKLILIWVTHSTNIPNTFIFINCRRGLCGKRRVPSNFSLARALVINIVG